MTKTLQVLGIGHALVDIIATCEETLLAEFSLTKGTMRLTSAEEAAALYEKMGPAVETSGGSAANTCAGIASLGGKAGLPARLAAINSPACSPTTSAPSASPSITASATAKTRRAAA